VLGVSTAEALHYLLAGAARGLDLTVSSFDPVLLGLIRRQLAGTAIGTALIGRASDPATTVLRATLEGGHDELHVTCEASGRTQTWSRLHSASGCRSPVGRSTAGRTRICCGS